MDGLLQGCLLGHLQNFSKHIQLKMLYGILPTQRALPPWKKKKKKKKEFLKLKVAAYLPPTMDGLNDILDFV